MKPLFTDKSKLSSERKQQLITFCRNVNIKFNNLELLDLAFHHRSYSNENSQHKRYNNERLEFLGDSVLGMSTAAFLYQDMSEYAEGELAKIKSIVVSEKSLAPAAVSIGIDKMLILGNGEELSGGRSKPAILADCMEAVIGAYYLDAGYEKACDFVLKFIIPEIRKIQNDKGSKDYKTLLQEFSQQNFKEIPLYSIVDKTGPDHDQTFYIQVTVHSKIYGPCKGKSKKEGEQAAAELALENLKVK